MHNEIEAKLQLTADVYEALLARGTVRKSVEQLNVYYDSGDGLLNNDMCLRIRYAIGKTPELCFKELREWDDGIFDSAEFHKDFSGDAPEELGIEHLSDEMRASIHPELFPLKRVGFLWTLRTVLLLEDVGVVELDKSFFPGCGWHTDYELEIEREDPAEALSLIQDKYPSAQPSLLSKYARFRQAQVIR